jgi:hypothetical protein
MIQNSIDSPVYQEMLDGTNSFRHIHAEIRFFVFQQDGVPAHTTRETMNYLKKITKMIAKYSQEVLRK